jgi:hypothetical protein
VRAIPFAWTLDWSFGTLYDWSHAADRVIRITPPQGILARSGDRFRTRDFGHDEMDRWLTERGVTLIGADLDESPMAYRRLPEVLAHHAGSVKVLHTLRPFAVAMAGDGEFDPWKD